MRRIFVVLIAVALAIGVFVFWPRSDGDDPPVTIAEATTTTTQPPATTTSVAASSTISADDSHVVETEAEAEEILRELWFGWFEGIYNQDEDRIREVVILEETVDTARESFGIDFQRAPEPEDITFDGLEILRSDDECLAVWVVLTTSGFREGSAPGVEVLRWDDGSWKSLSTWTSRNDLWEDDCESSL